MTAAAGSAAATQLGSIEAGVHGAANGQIVFRYDTWPDVTGDENDNLNRRDKFHGEFHLNTREGDQWKRRGHWIQGPMAVVLTVRDGQVTGLKFGIGEERWNHADNAVDLGHVAGAEAARYLLGLAGTTTRDDLGEDAIVAAVFIREAAVFALSQRPESEAIPSLTRLARSSRHPGVRKDALFWLAQHDDPEVIQLFKELLTRD